MAATTLLQFVSTASKATFFGLLFSSSPHPTIAFQSSSNLNRVNPTQTINNHRQQLKLHSTKSTQEETDTYGINAPYKEANYDPHAAAEYYKDRPIESFSRLTQIVGKSSGFIVDTILDAKFNREEEVSVMLCCCVICFYQLEWYFI